MFIYNPSLLLMGTPTRIIVAVVTSLVGIICLGAAIIGYLKRTTRLYERSLLFAAAFLLIKPGWATDLIGLLCAGIVLILQVRKSGFKPLNKATT
jgi:TRAP-type uncharacterized transport system fused permease subunit